MAKERQRIPIWVQMGFLAEGKKQIRSAELLLVFSAERGNHQLYLEVLARRIPVTVRTAHLPYMP